MLRTFGTSCSRATEEIKLDLGLFDSDSDTSASAKMCDDAPGDGGDPGLLLAQQLQLIISSILRGGSFTRGLLELVSKLGERRSWIKLPSAKD